MPKVFSPEAGRIFFLTRFLITQHQYGPVNLLVWHNKKYKEPLYLLTNLDYPAEISRYFKKLFIIETFFPDQKTKGIQLHRSRLDDPERIMHLLITACLAYISVFSRIHATNSQLMAQIHRKSRCDWSIYTTGKRALQYLIDQRIWDCLSYNLLL